MNYPYRAVNGSCNNGGNGVKGESFTGYSRMVPAEYLDGVYEPRRASNKRPLPSPRLISTAMSKNEGMENKVTVALMQWGQFIEHDLTRTATSIMVHNDNSIVCCGNDGNHLSPRYKHPFCHPIAVPYDDPFYSQHSVDCMTYVRSVPILRSDCSLGPIEQVSFCKKKFFSGLYLVLFAVESSYTLHGRFPNVWIHVQKDCKATFLYQRPVGDVHIPKPQVPTLFRQSERRL